MFASLCAIFARFEHNKNSPWYERMWIELAAFTLFWAGLILLNWLNNLFKKPEAPPLEPPAPAG